MNLIFKSKLPLLMFTLAFAAGSASADTSLVNRYRINNEQLLAQMADEVERDGQQFKNAGEDTQLRHRVNEQDLDQAKKERHEVQQKTQSQHQNQWNYGNGGTPMGGGSSMPRSMGGGGGGGGRR